MFIESKQKGQGFKEWKQEMDYRAQTYVERERAKEKKILPAPATKAADGTKIEVQEDAIEPGVWNVIMNGQWLSTFRGPEAHQNALRFVNAFLQ